MNFFGVGRDNFAMNNLRKIIAMPLMINWASDTGYMVTADEKDRICAAFPGAEKFFSKPRWGDGLIKIKRPRNEYMLFLADEASSHRSTEAYDRKVTQNERVKQRAAKWNAMAANDPVRRSYEKLAEAEALFHQMVFEPSGWHFTRNKKAPQPQKNTPSDPPSSTQTKRTRLKDSRSSGSVAVPQPVAPAAVYNPGQSLFPPTLTPVMPFWYPNAILNHSASPFSVFGSSVPVPNLYPGSSAYSGQSVSTTITPVQLGGALELIANQVGRAPFTLTVATPYGPRQYSIFPDQVLSPISVTSGIDDTQSSPSTLPATVTTTTGANSGSASVNATSASSLTVHSPNIHSQSTSNSTDPPSDLGFYDPERFDPDEFELVFGIFDEERD